MADIRRFVRVELDRPSAKKMEADTVAALDRAGKEGGENFFRELRSAFDKRMGELREALARGLIDEKEFRRQADVAAREFNRGLLSNVQKLREEGKLTDREFLKFSRSLKTVGDTGTSAFGRIKDSVLSAGKALVAGFTAYRAVQFLRDSIDASNELEAAQRRLEAAAKITGERFDFLQQTADQARQQFELSVPLANDLTVTTTKFASKAGDASKNAALLAATLDLAAAQGYDAAQAGEFLEQTLRGQDEGLDRLLQKNPSVVYKEWADANGVAAAKMTDAQKALAVQTAILEAGGRVRGEYAKWLESAAGGEFLLKQRAQEAKQTIGTEFRPVLMDLFQTLKDNDDLLQRTAHAFAEIARFFGGAAVFTIRVVGKVDAFLAAVNRIGNVPTGDEIRQAELSGNTGIPLPFTDQVIGGFGPDGRRHFLGAPRRPDTSPGNDPIESAGRAAVEARMEANRAAEAERKRREEARKAAEAEAEARAKAAREREKELDAEVTRLQEGARLGLLNAEDMARAMDLQKQTSDELAKGNLSLERRIELTQRLNDLQAIVRIPSIRELPSDVGDFRTIPSEETGVPKVDLSGITTEADDFGSKAKVAIDPWLQALDVLQSEVDSAAEGLGALFAAWMDGGVASVARLAIAKVKENVAWAIEELAKAAGSFALGNPASGSLHLKAAAEHSAAAAAWGLVGGVAGGGGGHGAGAGAGAGAIASNAPSGQAAASQAKQPDTVVQIYIDPLDPTKPAYQRNVAAAVQGARERYRDAKITVYPRTGAGDASRGS